jgi:N-alpha-acetyltransferase 35, NatC auxiliary subunit
VTHLYNRSLLHEIPETEVFTLLDEALWWLEKKEARSISEQLREALRTRLEFRKAFLGAVSKDVNIIKDPSTIEWEACAKYLQTIADSHKLGKPVEQSFSVKIQRKLASTVPPRPMVNISFENALSHLKRLCQDGIDLAAVLNFCGSNDLMVSKGPLNTKAS